MNPLQKYPNLFTNGRFRARVRGITIKVIGSHVSCGQWLISKHSGDHQVENCTLIARPIESLSDEEIFNLFPHITAVFTADDYREVLRQKARDDELQFKDVRKLANKGVYFGPQEDFGDTVIDTRTLKTNA